MLHLLLVGPDLVGLIAQVRTTGGVEEEEQKGRTAVEGSWSAKADGLMHP